MTRNDAPLSVALFATNDPRNYSGGRYLSLVMAYALAHAGCNVTVYTDHLPSFDADLAPLAPGLVRFVITSDFREGVEVEPLDWVVMVPTGIFLPGFYDAVTDHVAACGAKLALVNFESANWYNAASPHPRDARLWNSWRQSCLDGALVLSIAREGLIHARDFYVSPHAEIRFDVWHPPINSPLAEQFDGLERRPLVVSFVRPSDPHKGGLDLLALPPALLAGHELALVAGRDIDPAYLASVEKHFAAASGTQVSVHTRISDAAKLQLLSEARLLLFPSYFEGYGYPPIEALYCGTPVVCYDLPVLRETVGDAAHLVPPGDNAAFAAAVAAALATPADPQQLRQAVHRLAHFPSRADALVDLLVRHGDSLPVRPAPAFLASVGPAAGTKPRAAGPQDQPPLPPLPFHLTDARTLADGSTAVTALTSTIGPLDRATADIGGQPFAAVLRPADVALPHGRAWRVHLVLPADLATEAEVRVKLHFEATVVAEEVFRLRAPAPASAGAAPAAGVLSLQRVGAQLHLHAWALADTAVEQVCISWAGAEGVVADISEDRPELAASYPGLGSTRAGFAILLPFENLPAAGLDLLLLGGGRTLGSLRGWPSAAKDSVAAVQRGRYVEPAAARIAPAELSNSHWRQGISLFGDTRAPSVFTTYERAAETLAIGSRLRFQSGTIARVVQVQKKTPFWNVFVDRPLNPALDGHPATVEILPPRRGLGDGRLDYAAAPEGDTGWLHGVRIADDAQHRCAVRLKAGTPAANLLEACAVLRFAHAGPRTVLRVDEMPGALVVWLDAQVSPLRDGAPQSVQLIHLPQPEDRLLTLVTTPACPRGVEVVGERRARLRVAADEAAAGLAPGVALRFDAAGLLAVEAVEPVDDHLVVSVAGALDPEQDGAPHAVQRLADPASVVCPRRPAAYPVPAFVSPDPFHLKLAERCVPTQSPPDAGQALVAGGRPRVLFLTLVPPTPANQGNRVVTRNLIRHLIDLGYDVDVVMQGWIDVPAFITEFGTRARLYHCAFPNWNDTAEAKARAEARRDLKPALTPLHANLAEGLSNYHPFFIVRDEIVDRTRTLLQSARYDSIVCNYLHMARVVKELEDEFELPRTCIITHDALSSLTRRLGNTVLDTTYRACTPQIERDALNAVADGVAVAISTEEQRYFRDIGVSAPIVLCEYDGADEFAQAQVHAESFHSRTLFYAASSNPLNLAGLGWFLDECWPLVLQAVPDAQLVVSGPICASLPAKLPGVTLAGNVEREALLDFMRHASVAINPCVVGTGLKIKTVEAACMGLPAVCLPAAIDGLQDVAARFAIAADDAQGFTAGCVALLTDADLWQTLRAGGLAVAHERFAHEVVYRELDAAMGWQPQTATPVAPGDDTGLLGPGLTAEDRALFANPGALFALQQQQPDNPAWQLALARQLAQAGERSYALRLAERASAAAPGNPHYTAVAARLAIDDRLHWLAALHAARLVAGPNGVRPEGYALLGEALVAMGRHEAGRDALLQALAVAPGDPALLALLADAAEHLKAYPLRSWALRQTTPGLQLGETRTLCKGGTGMAQLVSGWSYPESWWTWTEGEMAVLDLSLAEPATQDLQITLLCEAFTPYADSRSHVRASVGGRALDAIEFTPEMTGYSWSFRCPQALLGDGTRLQLSLRIAKPTSPAELGMSPDPRRLGIAVQAVRVDAAMVLAA